MNKLKRVLMGVLAETKPTRTIGSAKIQEHFASWHDLRNPSEPIGKVVYYDLPLPYLRFTEGSYPFSVRLHMSGNGLDWIRGCFPHVHSDGELTGCMQNGKFRFDPEDPISALTGYSVSYTIPVEEESWEYDGFFQGLPVRSPGSPANYDPHLFMRAWESKTVEEMCAHVNRLYGLAHQPKSSHKFARLKL